jgi:hypothetical protein
MSVEVLLFCVTSMMERENVLFNLREFFRVFIRQSYQIDVTYTPFILCNVLSPLEFTVWCTTQIARHLLQCRSVFGRSAVLKLVRQISAMLRECVGFDVPLFTRSVSTTYFQAIWLLQSGAVRCLFPDSSRTPGRKIRCSYTRRGKNFLFIKFQTGCGAQQAVYSLNTVGLSPGGGGVTLATHLHLVTELRMSGAIPLWSATCTVGQFVTVVPWLCLIPL